MRGFRTDEKFVVFDESLDLAEGELHWIIFGAIGRQCAQNDLSAFQNWHHIFLNYLCFVYSRIIHQHHISLLQQRSLQAIQQEIDKF